MKASNTEELKGLGFAGAVKKLQGNDELRAKFIGQNQELQVAFNAMASQAFQTDLERILPKVVSEVASGGQGLQTRVQNFVRSPEIAAKIEKQNAAERNEIAGIDVAVAGMRRDALVDKRRADLTAAGIHRGLVGPEAALTVLGGMQGKSLDEARRDAMRTTDRVLGDAAPQALDKQLAAKIAKHLESIDSKTKPEHLTIEPEILTIDRLP